MFSLLFNILNVRLINLVNANFCVLQIKREEVLNNERGFDGLVNPYSITLHEYLILEGYQNEKWNISFFYGIFFNDWLSL